MVFYVRIYIFVDAREMYDSKVSLYCTVWYMFIISIILLKMNFLYLHLCTNMLANIHCIVLRISYCEKMLIPRKVSMRRWDLKQAFRNLLAIRMYNGNILDIIAKRGTHCEFAKRRMRDWPERWTIADYFTKLFKLIRNLFKNFNNFVFR